MQGAEKQGRTLNWASRLASCFTIQNKSFRWGEPWTGGYVAAWRMKAAPSPETTAQLCSSFLVVLPWAEDCVRAHPQQPLHYILLLLVFLLSSVSFSVMDKSHFLGITGRFESQMMQENSSSLSSGLLNNLCTVTSSYFLVNTAQICHCSFFILLFSGFGFLSCSSWWAQHCFPWSSVHLCFHWHAQIPYSFWHSDLSSFPFYLLTVFSHLLRYDFQAVWQLLLLATL